LIFNVLSLFFSLEYNPVLYYPDLYHSQICVKEASNIPSYPWSSSSFIFSIVIMLLVCLNSL
jgi:hypothetical protein